MRGKPLDFHELISKIERVQWTSKTKYLPSMRNGWMYIWRREWIFLYEQLVENKNINDPIAAHLRHKLSYGYNKLYLSKKEQPWLVNWLKQQCQNGIDPKYFE
jgi:hypothetical protein